MSAWQAYLDAQQERFIQELISFLRIPSISALAEHAADVERAASWVADRLRATGVEHVQIYPTGGHPIVYGDWLGAPGRPTVLIYGHFDTQPADPLQLWSHPPFEPVIRDGRIYARGASDDKGNMLLPILAAEALLRTSGALPVNLKFFFEGQEEIASPQLPAFIAAHRELLAADFVISADGLQWSEEQPQLMVGCKGICAVQIDISGARADLHSGLYGGTVQNPIHALAQLIDTLRGADGKILVEGFYDAVRPLTPTDRAQLAAVSFDDEDYRRQLDVPQLFGEPGYTTLERLWLRPTLDVNGIWGGFQGEGMKTIIPNQAHAKISCRLVADQEPEQIVALLTAHVEKHAPPGIRATVTPLPVSARPYALPPEHPANQAAHAVLTRLYQREPYYIRLGGSLPVCDLFLKNLGAHTITLAFGLEDEQAHAPDEFFHLSSFARGQQAYCMLLELLGQDRST